MRKSALNSIYELAKINSKIVFIGSDLGVGVLDDFKKKFPDRFFMEGISEQAIVGMASGMALEGHIPFVNTIGTFFYRRALEQIIIDACLQKLQIRFIANGGGGVYAPLGPTHIAFEDISILRSIPNLVLVAPCDPLEMKSLILDSDRIKKPIYFRVSKGGEKVITDNINRQKIKIGKSIEMTEFRENMIFSTGIMTHHALKISKEFKNIGVTHFHTIKPLDEKYILNTLKKVKKVFIIEENLISGGFGSSILELLCIKSNSNLNKIRIFGIENKFPNQYGNQDSMLDSWGLSYKKIKNKILKCL